MIRKSRRITQTELADVLGVKKSTISLYETGKSDPADGYKITMARYFNVSLDYLIGVIEEEVCYYDSKKYLKLPDDVTGEEEKLINEFIDFIHSRRNRP